MILRGTILAVLVLAAPAAWGCAPGVSVRWEVVLGETSANAHWIVVERRVGDCDGPPQDVRVVTRGQPASLAETQTVLAPGPHAFAALVLDEDCVQIGEGCTSLALGADTPTIIVRVLPTTPATRCGPDCPVAACRGTASTDAGPLDAGAGALDAAALDATVTPRRDGSVDATSSDAGDAGRADADLRGCRSRATTFDECDFCGGSWCDPDCCQPGQECCADGVCRLRCDTMMMPP